MVGLLNGHDATSTRRGQKATPAELFRRQIRADEFHGASTAGYCPGYVQANLLILPRAYANDFRLLCKRNPVPYVALNVFRCALCPAYIVYRTKTGVLSSSKLSLAIRFYLLGQPPTAIFAQIYLAT